MPRSMFGRDAALDIDALTAPTNWYRHHCQPALTEMGAGIAASPHTEMGAGVAASPHCAET